MQENQDEVDNLDQLDLDKAIRYREWNSLTMSDAGKCINSKTVMNTFQLISTAPLKRVDDVNFREEAVEKRKRFNNELQARFEKIINNTSCY